MNINEKAAYLLGLMEGLQLDESKPETKILKAMADLLGDIASDVEDLHMQSAYVDDCISDIDESLQDLEDEVFGDYDDDDIDYCDCCDSDDCEDCPILEYDECEDEDDGDDE